MKKKFLFAASVLLMCLGHASADELAIGNVTVPQGGTADLTVNYSFTSTTDKVGFTFSIALPEGVSFVKDEDGDPVYQKDATSIDKLNIVCAGEGNFAGQPANATATIKGTVGTLLTLTLKADAGLAVGCSYDVNVTKVTFQERVDGSVKDINIDNFTFKVNIGEPAVPQISLQLELAAGWNWVSQNTENTSDVSVFISPVGDLLQRLLSDTQELVRDSKYGIVGNLTALEPQKGYRMQLSAAQDYAAPEGTWCFAADYPLSLGKGWNWIGYLPFSAMTVDDALAGLTPSENDRIVSQEGFADYKEGRWMGTLTVMKPGSAYHYKSGADVTFCYPTSYPAVEPVAAESRQTAGAPWSCDAHRYPDVMTMIVQTDIADAEGSPLPVAAFCGDECRGTSQTVDDMLFLTVHGTAAAGETIRFVAYDAATGSQHLIAEQMAFDGGAYGQVGEPLMLHVGTDVATAAEAHGMPVASVSVAGHRLCLNGPIAAVSLLSADGTVLRRLKAVPQDGIDLSSWSPGVYAVALFMADGSTVVRKFIR